MKLSSGELPLPEHIGFSQITNETIQFTWNVENITKPNKYDQVMLLAYNVEKLYSSFNITGQFRSTGADTLKLSVGRAPGIYQLYVAFVAADRSSQSDSVYLGTVNV